MRSESYESDQMHVVDYLQLIWSRKWIVLWVAVGVLAITIWSTLRTELLYQAVTTVEFNPSSASGLLEQFGGGLISAARSQDTEIEILKSRVIGEKTVVRLERHYALSPLPPGVSVELSGVKVTDKTKPGTYTVTFMDDAGGYRVRDPGGNVIGEGKPGQTFEGGDFSFTLSRVSAKAGTTVQILVPKLAAVANSLRGSLSVDVIRGTNIVKLKVSGTNPVEVAQVVNAFAETYVDFTREQKVQQLIGIRRFLQRQIDEFRKDPFRSGRAMAGEGLASQETESFLGRLSTEESGSSLGAPSVQDIRYEFARRILDLEMNRAALQFTYAPNHRVIVQLDREIAEYRSRLSKQLTADKEAMPFLDLLRESQVKLGIYNTMLQRQQETRIAEASVSGTARVIDQALPPETPVSPNVPRNMKVGGMLGLSLGIGLALLLGHLDRTVKDVKDLEDRVGLPVFGAIPEISGRGFGTGNGVGSSLSKRLIGAVLKPQGIDGKTLIDPFHLMLKLPPGTVAVEAYRALRTNIQFASPGLSVCSFLFTSVGPSDGKSLTVANLAIALSQMGKRVLVIDADLRKPVQHKLFGVETEVGLTDVLARNVPWSQAVITRDAVKNLDLIPSGKLPPNPAELLGGEAMRALLAEVQQHYDLVLLDSPPTLIVADACVLASLVQGVFLVVRAGVTTPEAIARVQSLLSTVNAKLIGTILNAIPTSNGIGPYGIGYYNYHSYYGAEQSENGGRLKQTAQHILSEAQKLFNRYL